jgi:hypothetical protein
MTDHGMVGMQMSGAMGISAITSIKSLVDIQSRIECGVRDHGIH